MKLITKAIEKQAQKQFVYGSDLNQKVVAKFFDPCSQWTWYLMNQDPMNPDYLWGIVKGHEVETGSFLLSELMNYTGRFGLKIERDKYFKPRVAREVLNDLSNGKHV